MRIVRLDVGSNKPQLPGVKPGSGNKSTPGSKQSCANSKEERSSLWL
jgi:hypothetical protein